MIRIIQFLSFIILLPAKLKTTFFNSFVFQYHKPDFCVFLHISFLFFCYKNFLFSFVLLQIFHVHVLLTNIIIRLFHLLLLLLLCFVSINFFIKTKECSVQRMESVQKNKMMKLKKAEDTKVLLLLLDCKYNQSRNGPRKQKNRTLK